MKPAYEPLPSIPEAKPDAPSDFYGVGIERYLDLNFGAGLWVRDPFEDRYVVFYGQDEDGSTQYLIIDRELRRYPVTVGRRH